MKDAHEVEMHEMLPASNKRGRPSTGKAMSTSERQAKFRRGRVTVTLSEDEWSALVAMAKFYFGDSNPYSCYSKPYFFSASQRLYRAGQKKSPMPSEFIKPVVATKNAGRESLLANRVKSLP